MIARLSVWMTDAITVNASRRTVEATLKDLKPLLLDSGYPVPAFWSALGEALQAVDNYVFPSSTKILFPLTVIQNLADDVEALSKLVQDIDSRLAGAKLSSLMVGDIRLENGKTFPVIIGDPKTLTALKKKAGRQVKKKAVLFGFDYEGLTELLQLI